MVHMYRCLSAPTHAHALLHNRTLIQSFPILYFVKINETHQIIKCMYLTWFLHILYAFNQRPLHYIYCHTSRNQSITCLSSKALNINSHNNIVQVSRPKQSHTYWLTHFHSVALQFLIQYGNVRCDGTVMMFGMVFFMLIVAVLE